MASCRGRNDQQQCDHDKFADVLRVNRTLKRLKLRRNRITCAGATTLADALERNRNSALVELDLQENRVGDAGVQSLLDMLQINTQLQEVHLYLNPFKLANLPTEQINDPRVKLTCMQEI